MRIAIILLERTISEDIYLSLVKDITAFKVESQVKTTFFKIVLSDYKQFPTNSD